MEPSETDPVEAVLAMGELGVAVGLLEARLRAARKAKRPPAEILSVLRQRAVLLEESAIDDDLGALARDAKRVGEAAAHPDANADDRARWAWALLMANAPGRARKAGGDDPMVAAGLAYARKPTAARRAALFASAGAHPERAVRLVLQRSEPVVAEARALFEARRARAPLPDRHTLRALRLLVAAMHIEASPDVEAVHALDPEYGLSPVDRLALRKARLTMVSERIGAASELLLQPWYALGAAAKAAGELALSVEAHLAVDGLLAKKRAAAVLPDRSALLSGVRRDLIRLGRVDEAASVVLTEEAVRAKRGLDVPYHAAHAEICEGRGDMVGCVTHWRLAVQQARESTHPAYGPGSPNLRLVEGWLRQAEARAAARSL